MLSVLVMHGKLSSHRAQRGQSCAGGAHSSTATTLALQGQISLKKTRHRRPRRSTEGIIQCKQTKKPRKRTEPLCSNGRTVNLDDNARHLCQAVTAHTLSLSSGQGAFSGSPVSNEASEEPSPISTADQPVSPAFPPVLTGKPWILPPRCILSGTARSACGRAASPGSGTAAGRGLTEEAGEQAAGAVPETHRGPTAPAGSPRSHRHHRETNVCVRAALL